jgi:Rne/Rng family ribonuclease
MNKELYVSSTPHETKVALTEDDQLAEVFFERDNEYTLAGSIYKGRVTRVLPGMQSAFVNIGLERDAFLYVSDFLELAGDEDDEEEFGNIPAPRTTVDLGKSQPVEEAYSARQETVFTGPETEEEPEAVVEDFGASENEQSAAVGTELGAGEEPESAEGTRRWRGRRRRGGRRGRRDDLPEEPEQKIEAVPPPQARPNEHSRPDFNHSQVYAPVVMPGESISKYRNLKQETPAEPEPGASEEIFSTPVKDFSLLDPYPAALATAEEAEDRANLERGDPDFAPEQVVERSAASEAQGDSEAKPAHDHELADPAEMATSPQNQELSVLEAGETETHAPTTASHEPLSYQQHSAPLVAPEGRTLEHEVLEEEEMDLPPVPDDISAMNEAAGDEGLILEEETLDADNGGSSRWLPKIEDVDEDDVVAAEMRGENYFAADAGEAHEDEDEEEEGEGGAGELQGGRAELRASSPTAGYQQRSAERSRYGRRYPDRGQRGGPRRFARGRASSVRHQPLISDLLKEGQEILVQIAKEPIGKKGARITSHIALPGRFLVYMPTVNHVGVSRKIASEEERQRLKRIVTSERENGIGGFIVRTAAANIKEDDLRADIRFLKHLWAEIKSRTESGKSPALIYHDLNLVERILRDQVNADFSQIWVDTEDEYERIVRFANRFQPALVRRIKLYTKDTPLFEQFGIQDEINRSLKSKVWLKSGGHIVINQTEALVAIDVNTGKYVGKTQRLEDTIVKTNVDAVKEIVRQIRLRDLGGIIVIDFIDMDERRNRQKVMQALEEALRNDRAPSKALQFNDFGLVAITRKRVKQSLERTLAEPCPYCAGAGFVKSVTTVCNELYIEMRKMVKVHDRSDITLRVNPEVAQALKAANGKLIGEMEEMTGKTILVKSDATLHQENFDIH